MLLIGLHINLTFTFHFISVIKKYITGLKLIFITSVCDIQKSQQETGNKFKEGLIPGDVRENLDKI